MCYRCMTGDDAGMDYDEANGFYRFDNGYARAMLVISDPEHHDSDSVGIIEFDVNEHATLLSVLRAAYRLGDTPFGGVVPRDVDNGINVFALNGDVRVFRGVRLRAFLDVVERNGLNEMLQMILDTHTDTPMDDDEGRWMRY